MSEQSFDNAIVAVDEAFGNRTVGGVVHCAGVGSVASALNRDGSATTLDHFKQVVDVNLTGSFNVACSYTHSHCYGSVLTSLQPESLLESSKDIQNRPEQTLLPKIEE